MIDYMGSYNYSFYNPLPYISHVKRYLSETASIVGGVDSFDRNSRSRKTVNATYKNSLNPIPDYKQYKKILHDEGFSVTEDEMIGICTSSGPYFEYHIKGDSRYTHTYLAKRTEKEKD